MSSRRSARWSRSRPASLPPETHRIGAHVAGLIDDGDTIQIGIGKVPAAVLAALRDRRDLGLHGGLVSDEVADLHEAGVMTGARKSHDRGVMVCTAALGSAAGLRLGRPLPGAQVRAGRLHARRPA